MSRLFVAVWPPAVVVDQLSALPRRDEPGVRWVASDSWHVTLRFLGDTDPDEVAARLAGAPLPTAAAVLGPVVSLIGRDTVVVPVAGLDELAAAVRAATADLGRPPDQRRFAGHVTLARLRDQAVRSVVGAPFRAEFPVSEVSLVESTPGENGGAYATLASYPTS